MAYYKKEKEIHHISEYDSYVKICELGKKRSPITILFCTNDLPDKWLIDVVEYKTKSGVITDTYMITDSDMGSHIKFMVQHGHDIITNF